jgi:hypothetical protein
VGCALAASIFLFRVLFTHTRSNNERQEQGLCIASFGRRARYIAAQYVAAKARSMMASRDQEEDEEAGGLPWDPLWAYVLGENDEDRDQHSLDEYDGFGGGHSRQDESRDAGGEGLSGGGSFTAPPFVGAVGGGARKLWQRLKQRDSLTSESRDRSDQQRDSWQWELDTSPFQLTSSPSMEERRKEELRRSKKESNKKADDSSWIGAVWRDPRRATTPRSMLRKSTS